ncbi:uncharacterized protein L969DRAFT_45249 [Mixia osmundae IAM 14324]|uniref:Uncharacterized protein n=1 Tax=Mixia osmundae (strain CBS 9802 / IAM 14324 / JCM 22182 / KY 12970) TaxID=764103 RepID=G7DXM5_MIXOS|nr:uncharacterized protein L969DRAFT_45249 [Mixia osmundae IAM 14324]KEI41171.1 hypothetical protein L969DRAFT_45249 [Mixia osmundae IAM 14324]GAA95335.1 hypothetical protein E5Q_01992 [Mixia osmundae IAM 14324]
MTTHVDQLPSIRVFSPKNFDTCETTEGNYMSAIKTNRLKVIKKSDECPFASQQERVMVRLKNSRARQLLSC